MLSSILYHIARIFKKPVFIIYFMPIKNYENVEYVIEHEVTRPFN